jgi:ribonuclease T1
LRLLLENFSRIRYHRRFGFQGNPVLSLRLPSPRQSLSKLALAIAVGGILAGGGHVAARAQPEKQRIESVALAALPPEARQTEQRIRSGGPFPYAKDGSVFGNRERLLPVNARGYYREYTVKTPGAQDRGARRVVCGGRQPAAPDACFYTDDHYASFMRIAN